ncbi:MAG: hypothetical protein U1B94_03545 [candidate division NC10 bacterium]|jgi:hypothetical protein|nr:hypothetical protein [candidate division NC10 bacterium]
MSPVLEIPEAMCADHGLYQGLACPGCSEDHRPEHENRPPIPDTALPL